MGRTPPGAQRRSDHKAKAFARNHPYPTPGDRRHPSLALPPRRPPAAPPRLRARGPLRQLGHDGAAGVGGHRRPGGDLVDGAVAAEAEAGRRVDDAELDAGALDLVAASRSRRSWRLRGQVAEPVEQPLQDIAGGDVVDDLGAAPARGVGLEERALGGDGGQPLVPEGDRQVGQRRRGCGRRRGSTGRAGPRCRPCCAAGRGRGRRSARPRRAPAARRRRRRSGCGGGSRAARRCGGRCRRPRRRWSWCRGRARSARRPRGSARGEGGRTSSSIAAVTARARRRGAAASIAARPAASPA